MSSQVPVNLFTTTAQGLVPAPGQAVGFVLLDNGKWGNVLGPITVNSNGVGNGNALTVNGNVNVAGIISQNGAPIIQSGTFTATLHGCTTSPTATAFYTIIGGPAGAAICIVEIAAGSNLVGTSNAATMSISGLPAICQPATQFPLVACGMEDNGIYVLGAAEIQPGSGSIVFFKSTVSGTTVTANAAGFVSTGGTKGLDGTVLVYSLA